MEKRVSGPVMRPPIRKVAEERINHDKASIDEVFKVAAITFQSAFCCTLFVVSAWHKRSDKPDGMFVYLIVCSRNSQCIFSYHNVND